MNWEKSIFALVSILENPFIENGYKELKKYYESNKMEYEADCVDLLINKKFKNDNNSNINKE